MLFCAGCGGNIADTATPDFFTATLPPTLALPAEQTATLPAPTPSAVEKSNPTPAVEGTTTTQVNVRAEPSTASASLGMVGPFVKVQISGRDASGSWYQIIYSESESGKAWVRAEYVQVNAPVEIGLVETTSSSGSGVSGLVIQKINVRKGPGTEYESLGVLNSNDVVFITGKDLSGSWVQIEFVGAPDGRGWVTEKFLQVENIEAVPLVGAAAETATPNAMMTSAMQDDDSMQVPLAVAVFSPTGSRALQVSGDVSAVNGDMEDWVKFTPNSETVAIKVTCASDTLRVTLWRDGKPLEDILPACGNKIYLTVSPNSGYFLRLAQMDNQPGYTNYVLSLESVH